MDQDRCWYAILTGIMMNSVIAMMLALLIAGGSGSRMGQSIPKQFLTVNEKPVIVYTLEIFQKHPEIDSIAVVCIEGWESVLQAYANQFNITKMRHIIPGGKNGQESIRNGVYELEKHYLPSDIVLIHDAIRPMVSADIISDCIRVTKEKGNAITAIPCAEAMIQTEDGNVSVDYVVHAAGNAHPTTFNRDPVGTIWGNIKGTYNLLEYCKSCKGKRFLYVSSGEVYGQGDLSVEEFEEKYAGYIDILSPRSCYPSSKRAVENLCASYYSQYGLETLIVRPCHTYGPGITMTDSRANAQFFRNVLNGEDIVMKSAGTQLRSYNYVADCASAILTVLFNGEAGQAYNIANPKVRITIAQLADIIAKKSGRKGYLTC